MSTVIAGNPNNITTPLSATVTAIVDNGSGAQRVTTSAPHLFGNEDSVNMRVTISGTVFNYTHPATIIDATHFDLIGSTYIGMGTGTAYDLSLTPQILFPTDGDSFSLQLSGMLSGLKALADRTQALRKMMTSGVATMVSVTASGNVPIPLGATLVWVDGWGGGGGGGGGPGGDTGASHVQAPAGGGGAGSRRVQGIFPLPTLDNPTSLDIVLGAGGTGGAGSSGNVSPLPGSPGSDGGSTTVTVHDGALAGFTFSTLLGGAGGGGGGGPLATSTGTPTFTPGGHGAAGLFRSGPAGLYPQSAPGYRQLNGIANSSGTLSAPGGAWQIGVYTDPVGQMDYYEGGASVANGGNATYAAAVSYAGAPGFAGEFLGGAAGSYGTASGIWPGGAGGGGGGAGGNSPGGAGGNGGNGSTGTATNGVAGASASANSGGGGGGGGGGGNGSSASGNGEAGGNGGSGRVNLIFFAVSM